MIEKSFGLAIAEVAAIHDAGLLCSILRGFQYFSYYLKMTSFQQPQNLQFLIQQEGVSYKPCVTVTQRQQMVALNIPPLFLYKAKKENN